MATYVHLNSTCILEQALLLKYQQPPHIPRGANHDPGQAPIQPPDGMQIGSGEFRQIQVWLHEMFPKWWPLPHEEFNQHVASIREAVHNACHAMDYGYLDEIRAFFMHLQPLVDHFFANEGYSRRQGIPRGDDDRDSQSMDLDLSHNTQTTVQVEEMEMDIDNDDEMNNASYFHALAMLFSRTLPLEQRGSRKKVQRRQVEGDCAICLSPLKGCEKCMLSDGCACELSVDCPTGKIEISIQSGHDYDDDGLGDQLVWCKAFCGINYHAECFDGWIDQFKIMQEVKTMDILSPLRLFLVSVLWHQGVAFESLK